MSAADNNHRKTTQFLLPVQHKLLDEAHYQIYPTHQLASGSIEIGYSRLAEIIIGQNNGCVIIDGYPGVLWDVFQKELDEALREHEVRIAWHNISDAMLPEDSINHQIEPYLGNGDPLFGFRYPGSLSDFFDHQKITEFVPNLAADINIVIGTGSALANWSGLFIYVDVPKNEIQFRSRANTILNLGAQRADDPKSFYKRSYFIDWVVANQHKQNILPLIDIFVDDQRPYIPIFMTGDSLRKGLNKLSHSVFRVRPWFEPGPWGGQWIKEQVPQLPQEVVNYAWSFELIVPENGILFESDGYLIEMSFDFLMYHKQKEVLGECAEFFQTEFPIRFDFLDTFEGGNLSLQVHPRQDFIKKLFGETYTQDETYYILDTKEGAYVYLGFQDTIIVEDFKQALINSQQKKKPVNIENYILRIPVKKHDLLLIPNGTVHGSGINNLVLEISATPYIFTFKLYDWLRLDLDGNPRPLNIERAFENLDFERKGQRIQKEFISTQYIASEGDDWRLIHCPTHSLHFYDVYRYEFCGSVDCQTGGVDKGSFHVLSLVEGSTVLLVTEAGHKQRFHYAETFVVPAATGAYQLISETGDWIKVIRASMKPISDWIETVTQTEEHKKE